MSVEILSQARCFGGRQLVFRHASAATGTPMRCAVYLPPAADHGTVPAVLYLSGLTCTEDNVTVKAGAQRVCAELGLAFIAPDTSPRGDGVADDPGWDLGQGAGFYVDATQAPWAPHFAMERYVIDELLGLVSAQFPIRGDRIGITGHSMGGHGALTLALRHPGRFASVSAFSPIVAPTQVPWGRKAFTAYLGPDEAGWAEHDACELLRTRRLPGALLVDQGDADPFLREQLRTELLQQRCDEVGQRATIRMQPGYDHSYFFVASFIEDHLRHHAQALAGG